MSKRFQYILASIIYGTVGMFLRQVSFPSEIVVLCRGLIGSLFVFLFLKFKGQPIDHKAIEKNRIWLILSGIMLGLNWVFLFAAYIKTTVAIASLCNYMAPILFLLATPIFLHEKLEMRKIPFVILAFIGIILVSGVFAETKANVEGVIYGLLAALTFTGLMLCNRKIKDISSYDKTIVQLAISAITVLPYVLFKNFGITLVWDLKSILIVLMLGIVHTGIAYCLYFGSLGSLPVQSVAILGYIEPVVSVLCSTIFLHEPMAMSGWIGTILILGSAIVSETL